MKLARLACGRWMIALLCAAVALPVGAAEHGSNHAADHSAHRSANQSTTAKLLSGPGATFTLPAPRFGWVLIAYGDMRFTDPANREASNARARRELVQRIGWEKPDLLVLSGDVPYEGGNPEDWDVYRRETGIWRREGLRIFPTLGNHELYSKKFGEKCGRRCLENWWSAFPELRHRRWYSVRFGSAYLITVDSNLELTPGSEQARWVAGQLAGLPPQVRYVFVSLHHPPVADPVAGGFSHDVRPNEAAFARQLEEAAPHLRAKIIVIAGHIHNYERFERNGVVYLVSGGGGAHPYHVARSAADLYRGPTFPNFHYLRFDCEPTQLRAVMLRLDKRGEFSVKDRFVIRAARHPATKSTAKPEAGSKAAGASGAR